MKSGFLLFNPEELCQKALNEDDQSCFTMEKTSHKMKQFILNTSSAYFINNRNKIFSWGESILNFKSFNKDSGYNEAVTGLRKSLKKRKKSLQKYLSMCKNPLSKSCTAFPKLNAMSSGLANSKNRRSYPTIEDLSEIHEEEEKDLLPLLSQSIPTEIVCTGNIKIKNLKCSEKCMLFLTEEGTLFSCGNDPSKTGVLGQGKVYHLDSPEPIQTLLDYKVKNYDICQTHACATESSGKLFTWGKNTSYQCGLKGPKFIRKPVIVEIYKAAEVKEAQVSRGYTAFKTSGGYLYVMGNIKSKNNTNDGSDLEVFHQIQGISNYFIRTFICTPKFITILTQTGELLYIDHEYKITKIHSDSCKKSKVRDDRIESLAVTKDHIISLSRNRLYIWKPVKAKPPIHPAHGRQASALNNSRGTISSERNHIEQCLNINAAQSEGGTKEEHKRCSSQINNLLKPRNSVSPIPTTCLTKTTDFTCKSFKITEKEKLYECKLGEGICQKYCVIYYISQSLNVQCSPISSYLSSSLISGIEKPFLKECIRNPSVFRNVNTKERWKSILESAIEDESVRNSESFCSKSNGYSMIRDILKSESCGSLRDNQNRNRFNNVKSRIQSLQNLHQQKDAKRAKSHSLSSSEKTFTDKIEHFERLLSQMKNSPTLKHNQKRIDDQANNSSKKQLVDSFGEAPNEPIQKMELVPELDLDCQDENKKLSEEDTPEIEETEAPKSNLFNLVSLCRKKNENNEEEKFAIKKPESGTLDTNYPTEEGIEQESITEQRRKHKREHKRMKPKVELDNITKTLQFEETKEEPQQDLTYIPNPFEISCDEEIQAIEEVSNETFSTINDDKELVKQDGSLFGCPQTTIINEEHSFSEKGSEVKHIQESGDKQYNITSISFQKKESEKDSKGGIDPSPMVYSPDFERNGSRNSELLLGNDSIIHSMKKFSEKDSFHTAIAPIQSLSNTKMKESEPSVNINSPNPLNSSIHQQENQWPREFIQKLNRLKTDVDCRLQKEFFAYLKDYCNKQKNHEVEQRQVNARLSILKGASHAFSLVFKQIQKKLVINSFNEIKTYCLEKKIATSFRNSFASNYFKDEHSPMQDLDPHKVGRYNLYLLLKNSNINTQLTKFVKVCESLEKRNLKEAFLNFKSLQFCSIHKIKQIEERKQKEFLSLKQECEQKLQRAEKSFCSKSDLMTQHISDLQNKNQHFENTLRRSSLRMIHALFDKTRRRYALEFLKRLKEFCSEDDNDSINSRITLKNSEASGCQLPLKIQETDPAVFETRMRPFDNKRVINKILEKQEINSSISCHSERGRNKPAKVSKNNSFADSASNKLNSENSSYCSNNHLQKFSKLSISEKSSNVKVKPDSERATPTNCQIVLGDFGNLGKATQQLSTAEFRSHHSSEKHYSAPVSPPKEKIICKPEKVKTAKRDHRDYLTSKDVQKMQEMIDLEPDNGTQAPYIRRSSKKNGECDEVHAEPFEIIESEYFKKLIKEGPKYSKKLVEMTPKNLNFETEKTEKKIQTSSFLEHDFYDPRNNTNWNTTKSSADNIHQTMEEKRTFNSLASLRNLIDKPINLGHIKKQKKEKNFIAQNIKNITKYKNKKNKVKKKENIVPLNDSKFSYIHTLASKKPADRYNNHNSNSRRSLEPKISLQEIDSCVNRRETFLMNTQTPLLNDKHLNIFIQTSLDESIDSDCELQIKCSQNDEISILEEYI
ncbi:unnamed protein product [Moneuplotes crassus]|uniref:Uncharacterized protein n=1 Tax=Euplotes crassus TaxID=5936 RepID=A0AAD2D8B4_EUPCR|nr:unnamed protein product [Moneuplotes crassus]